MQVNERADQPITLRVEFIQFWPTVPSAEDFCAMSVVDLDYRLEFKETRANAGHQESGSGQLCQALQYLWMG